MEGQWKVVEGHGRWTHRSGNEPSKTSKYAAGGSLMRGHSGGGGGGGGGGGSGGHASSLMWWRRAGSSLAQSGPVPVSGSDRKHPEALTRNSKHA